MIPEKYLEYLALDSILQGYMSSRYMDGSYDDAEIWYADNAKANIDLVKLKARATELQKEFLSDYVIN